MRKKVNQVPSRGSYVQEEQFADFDFDIEVKIKEPVITVQLTDINSGLKARASAKRNDPDKFSVEVGKKLALARALGRFARRVEKQVMRDLDLVAT